MGEELRIAPSVEVDMLVDVDDFLGSVCRNGSGESDRGVSPARRVKYLRFIKYRS
jgi:hypothetical protein